MAPREKRSVVRLSAQMRSGTGWSDIHIHNVSGRGMMLSRADRIAPPPGSYLEVRRGTVAVVARIVWRNGRKFGIRSQDSIDLAGLIAATPNPTVDAVVTANRKAARRTAASNAPERSRALGRLFQYAALLAAIGVGTVALAGLVASALAPLRTIQASLVLD